MSAWAVTMGAGATMGSCMSHLPFHAGGGRGHESITWTPAMAKHNSRIYTDWRGNRKPHLRPFSYLMRDLPLKMRHVPHVEHAYRAAPAADPRAFSYPCGVGITFALAEGREQTDKKRLKYHGGILPRGQPHGRLVEPLCRVFACA